MAMVVDSPPTLALYVFVSMHACTFRFAGPAFLLGPDNLCVFFGAPAFFSVSESISSTINSVPPNKSIYPTNRNLMLIHAPNPKAKVWKVMKNVKKNWSTN